MKALVFHGVGDVRLDTVPDPELKEPTDAIVRLTSSAICGTDLHFVRGTMPGVKPGTVLGHEGVGVVEEVGAGVRNFRPGDRVVIGSTIACGACSYCRAGYQSQCDDANPEGEGTAFFGGPESAGGFDGLQAELARIPHANVTMVKVPEGVDDDQALMISDIFPTGYFGADLAEVEPGRTVAVYGCGPVGMYAIQSALMMGAGRVIAIDEHGSRLETARALGAETVDFSSEDPVEAVRELTRGAGPDRVIDAVGVDAEAPDHERASEQLREIAPEGDDSGVFAPGSRPTQVLEWAVESIAKAGVLSIIGVYPPPVRRFPIGEAMMKNLRIKMGNCPHRRYIPKLLELARSGAVDPSRIITEHEPLEDVAEAYRVFDQRRPGWMKVALGT